MNLNELSILSLYSAMGVYAFAFIAFSIDLARRSSAVGAVQGDAPLATEPGSSVAAAGGTTTLTRISTRMANDAVTPYGRSASLRVGVSLNHPSPTPVAIRPLSKEYL